MELDGSESPTLTGALRVRQDARAGILKSPTTGLARGHIQANLLVLPSNIAPDFEILCARNPVPCPLLGKSTTPGNPHSFTPSDLFAGSDSADAIIDIRTDIPQYNVYQNGKLLKSKPNILEEWNETSVAFLIGCSFSFEAALTDAGLPPRQIQQSCNVPMYKTDVKLNPAGIFTGATQVVSMRPYLPQDIQKVREVTRPFVKTHGEPVAWGWDTAREFGITDIDKPDFGDAVKFEEGEVPVFWVSNRRALDGSTLTSVGLRSDASGCCNGCCRQDPWYSDGSQARTYAGPGHHRR